MKSELLSKEKFQENYKLNSIYKDNRGYYSIITGTKKRYSKISAIRASISKLINSKYACFQDSHTTNETITQACDSDYPKSQDDVIAVRSKSQMIARSF